jgi:hypothetical protein
LFPGIKVTSPVRTVAPDEDIPVTTLAEITEGSSFPDPSVVGIILEPVAATENPAAFVESSAWSALYAWAALASWILGVISLSEPTCTPIHLSAPSKTLDWKPMTALKMPLLSGSIVSLDVPFVTGVPPLSTL